MLEIEKQIPKIMEEIIKISCSDAFVDIFVADHSLTPQPLIEKGTIPIKFKKIEVNKSFRLDKDSLNAKTWTNKEMENRSWERKL